MLIFSLSSAVAELLAILWVFTKQKLQNMSVANAATWWQKLEADFLSLMKLDIEWYKLFEQKGKVKNSIPLFLYLKLR